MHAEEHFTLQWKCFICICTYACILYKHMWMYVYHGHANLAFIHLVYTQIRTGPSLGWMPVTFEENKGMGSCESCQEAISSPLPTSLPPCLPGEAARSRFLISSRVLMKWKPSAQTRKASEKGFSHPCCSHLPLLFGTCLSKDHQ